MTPPLTEKEQLFLDSLATTTGKDLDAWIEVIRQNGPKKFGEIIKYLQDEHAMEYRTAHSLTHLYMANKDKNMPTVTYTQSGRGGKVIYQGPEAHIELDWEFGGGNSVAIILIPTSDEWEAQTAILLSERQKILDFIGTQVAKDQVHGEGSYKIHYNSISIMSGPSHSF